MAELKPCPFCGGEAKTELSYSKCGGDELILRASVYCGGCGTRKGVTFGSMCKPFEFVTEQFDAVIAMWNRRADNG